MTRVRLAAESALHGGTALAINSIDPVDIGALRTLVLVYDLRSFSAAAERLNVNQSTISYTVERLRSAFQDPLFVRQGNGVTATERANRGASLARGIRSVGRKGHGDDFVQPSRTANSDPAIQRHNASDSAACTARSA